MKKQLRMYTDNSIVEMETSYEAEKPVAAGTESNYSSILTKLIQDTGRFCLRYASDLFILWDTAITFLGQLAVWNRGPYRFGFVFGIRECGVDDAGTVASNLAKGLHYYYRSIYVLEVTRSSEAMCMSLYKADSLKAVSTKPDDASPMAENERRKRITLGTQGRGLPEDKRDFVKNKERTEKMENQKRKITKARAVKILEDIRDERITVCDLYPDAVETVFGMAIAGIQKQTETGTEWIGIEDYPVSIKQVLNILAETGALTAQERIRAELKPYMVPSAQQPFDAIFKSLEELVQEYGEDGVFNICGRDISADNMLEELRTGTEAGNIFRTMVTKTIVEYFMKFGNDGEVSSCAENVCCVTDETPSAIDRGKVDEYLYHIKANQSVHASSDSVVAMNYWIEQLYAELFGEGEKPSWMK